MPHELSSDHRLSARELVLALMDSATSRSLSASYLIAAGQLFEMDPGSIRVALARLVRNGSLSTAGRGRYVLGSRAGTLHTLVRNWARAEQSLAAWSGGWLAVFVSHLARSNKTRVRGNDRALRLYGFAETQPGFWLRPDNLKDSLSTIRTGLLQLGLDPGGLAGRLTDVEPAGQIEPQSLWQVDALEAGYRRHLDTLAQSSRHLSSLDPASAAKETLVVGRRVTRDILLDPLLPDELVNAALRREMVSAMQAYDRIGKKYWREFYARHERTNGQKPAA